MEFPNKFPERLRQRVNRGMTAAARIIPTANLRNDDSLRLLNGILDSLT